VVQRAKLRTAIRGVYSTIEADIAKNIERLMIRRFRQALFGNRRPVQGQRHWGATPVQPVTSAASTPIAIPPAYGVLFDAATQELNVQLSSVDTLDTKAATIFSIASTVAVVVPALLPLGRKGVEYASAAFVLLCLGGLAYAATLILFFLSYRPGKWASGPRLDRLSEIITYGEDYARRWAADAYVLAIEATRKTVGKKQRYLNLAMWAFAGEIILLIAAAVSTFTR
jgi:hypothetical protein